MRLQKYMAKAGVASRRKSEEIITEGRVKVNEVVVKELGTKVNVGKDKVKVDNVSIRLENHMVYILLNKPIGYVSTLDDEKDRKIITDLIDNVDERIYPVGRLDIDSTGAMLLTNDGDLTYKITHPKNEVKKTYVAIVEGRPNRFELEKFRNGINLDGEITAPAEVKILKISRSSRFKNPQSDILSSLWFSTVKIFNSEFTSGRFIKSRSIISTK